MYEPKIQRIGQVRIRNLAFSSVADEILSHRCGFQDFRRECSWITRVPRLSPEKFQVQMLGKRGQSCKSN
jgi:hypothetical protein